MLGGLRKNITTHATDSLYNSFIVVSVYYCDSAWACCNKGDISHLERLQRCAAKIVVRTDSSEAA